LIAGLIGRVHRLTNDSVLLNVNGVIYQVVTSGRTIADIGAAGDEVELHTHFVVREDAQTLYGFLTANELVWFQTLIGVNGVGPRLACAVLTRFTPEALLDAISREEIALLSTVPGIGKRTASRILLDLRGKLPENLAGSPIPITAEYTEVIAALQALGYSSSEAQAAVAQLPDDPGVPVEQQVLAALRQMGSS
jgi:Holliday junction DNA helicase RuvA